MRQALDTAAELGAPCVYLPPGASDGRRWETLLDVFDDALAPCVAHAAAVGVAMAIEPSARTQVSFVNTLRDSLVVAERRGPHSRVVVDFASCWSEREFAGSIAAFGSRVALVQVSDIGIGAIRRSEDVAVVSSTPAGRLVPGDGDLELDRLVQAVLDAGYGGPFELELLGPAIEAEGHASTLRRAIVATSDLLTRAGA